MAVSIIGPKFYAWDSDTGKPLAFGKVYTYQAGTNTPKATFTSEGGETQNANPVILNGAGYADIYLNGSYKVVVKDADDVEVWTSDPVSDPSQLQQEWVRQRNITQVNTTTFTVDGGLTDEYVKGVLIRVKQDSGFVFGTVVSATYADGKTTVELSMLDGATISSTAQYAERNIVASFSSLGSDLVAHTGTTDTVTEALDKRTVFVGSVAELKTVTAAVGTNVYLTQEGRAGDFVVKSGTPPSDPQEGVYVVLDNGNYAERINFQSVTPEMFGAVGDGVADDTAAVTAWWEFPISKKGAAGEYLISGDGGLIFEVSDSSLIADLSNCVFNISAPRGYFLRADITTAGLSAYIVGGSIAGNGNVARPLTIESSNDVQANVAWVRRFNAIGVFGNTVLSYTSGVIGVSVSCQASLAVVDYCSVIGVNRDYVNPGLTASVGISVTNVVGLCFVENNSIDAVQSPAGDADADGISIFSRDKNSTGQQTIDIQVRSNRIRNAKGRFVKLQTTNAEVSGNTFLSTTGEIIIGFRAIDCQFGGCNIHGNFWDLYAGVTGGSEAVFVLSQFKDIGNWESQTIVHGNKLVLERGLRYFAFAAITGGQGFFNIKDNYVKEIGGSITNAFAGIDCQNIPAMDSFKTNIESNVYASDVDRVLLLVGDGFASNSSAATKFSYRIVDNENTKSPTSLVNAVVFVAGTDPSPAMSDFVIRNNITGGLHRLNSKFTDMDLLPSGNAFYYGTDGAGGATGLSNAPSGYVQYVHVNTDSQEQTLSKHNNGMFAKRITGSATWYQYSGTAL